MVCLLQAVATLAQTPLYLVDQETRVRSVKLEGVQAVRKSTLLAHVATIAPGPLDRFAFWRSETFPFSPVELQKDVARLRAVYRRNGFPDPSIDYFARLDSVRNAIDIVFRIDEGRPLLVQSLDFFTPQGRAAIYQFDPGKEQFRWNQLRSELTYLNVGDRLSDFELRRIEDRVLERLTNRGYAFATVRSEVEVDTLSAMADVRFLVDAGPQGWVDSLRVVGAKAVARDVLVRELPLRVGDRFEYRKLVRAQRKLFALDLFRVALVDIVPGQPVDSTVTLRIRVEEGSPRYANAQIGYARDDGVNLEGSWTHRNLWGDGRKLTARGSWATGWGALSRGDIITGNRQSFSVSLQQPYLGPTRATLIVAPFFDRRQDAATDAFEVGLSTTLMYEVLDFRPASLRHTFARAIPILGTREKIGRSLYNRSILELTGLLGKANDYIQPTRGLLVQPFVEFAGAILRSEVDYYRLGGEATYYRPTAGGSLLTLRMFAGILRPFGSSADQTDPIVTERLDPVQYYAGGAGDVRGYANRGLGPKKPVQSGTLSDGNPRYIYEPLGGFSKLSGNIDFRFPLSARGNGLFGDVFFDFGQLGQLEEGIRLRPNAFRYGTGVGIRYRTPVGMVGLDLAAKVNPAPEDLRRAADYAQLGASAPVQFRRRFNLHLSIGQAF